MPVPGACSAAARAAPRRPVRSAPTARTTPPGGLRIARGREVDEVDAVLETVDLVRRRLQGEARLPDPAGAGERQQPHAVRVEELADGAQLCLAAEELGRLRRQVVRRRLQRRRRGKSAGRPRGTTWKSRSAPDRSRSRWSPRSRNATLAMPRSTSDRGRLRDHDLAAVPGGHDPRRPMDVQANVAVDVTRPSPEWIPMRTRTVPPPAMPRAPAPAGSRVAEATASLAEEKTAKNESPSVPSSFAPRSLRAARMIRRWPAKRSSYASPNAWSKRVEPSMSLKKNVTVPVGRGGVITRPVSDPPLAHTSGRAR